MIKYALVCDMGHTFESWFSDSASFDTQAKRGFVECPQCQSKQVTKAMMAPAVSTSRKREVHQDPRQEAQRGPALRRWRPPPCQRRQPLPWRSSTSGSRPCAR
jgi:hypothetical protein